MRTQGRPTSPRSAGVRHHFKKLPSVIGSRSNIPKPRRYQVKDFWRPGSHARNRCLLWIFLSLGCCATGEGCLSHYVTRAEIYGGIVGSLHSESAWLCFARSCWDICLHCKHPGAPALKTSKMIPRASGQTKWCGTGNQRPGGQTPDQTP